MNKQKILNALENGSVEWRKHALERMLERDIGRKEVLSALEEGDIIEYYENDTPFESALFFYIGAKPVHVVASLDELSQTIYVITAYVPSTAHFFDDLKTRRDDET